MKNDARVLVVLGLLSLPAIAPLLQKGYFPMHDDLQPMRQLQLEKCIQDRQWPCRWVADMGYGYGYPLFNFYPPLPYLVGLPFRALGLQFTDVVKAIGIVGFGLAAIGMYLLGSEFFGKKGGLVAALFYTYAPYHSTDFYVRAAVNEFYALAFFPFIFWLSYRLIKDPHWKWVPWLALSVTGLMLSHNPMLMIFIPGFILWILFWVVYLKSLKSLKLLKYLTISALWALGLAAFFTLPVLFEQKYAHLETLTIGYFNFLAHFLDLKQMFWWINWGYGESKYGPLDTMSFAIGYLHWIVPLVVITQIRKFKFLSLLLLLLLGAMFMTHWKATPIWLMLKPLEFLQFPWRFLTLIIFYASFASGAVVFVFSRSRILLQLLLLLVLLLNANYFRPREWWADYGDKDRFSGRQWQLLLTSGIYDYLPKGAPLPPADPPKGNIVFTYGDGNYDTLIKKTNRQEYKVTVTSSLATVELQTFYFPGWKLWLNGEEIPVDPSRDPLLGRMQVDLSSGIHQITAKFTDTPIRVVGNVLSLVSWFGMLTWVIFGSIKSSNNHGRAVKTE